MLKPQIEKKDQVVQELKEKAAKAQIGILTDFSGLNVEAMTQLRRQVKEAQGELKVAKNTLLRRAAEEALVLAPRPVPNGMEGKKRRLQKDRAAAKIGPTPPGPEFYTKPLDKILDM